MRLSCQHWPVVRLIRIAPLAVFRTVTSARWQTTSASSMEAYWHEALASVTTT
jgi:hypothetical protein